MSGLLNLINLSHWIVVGIPPILNLRFKILISILDCWIHLRVISSWRVAGRQRTKLLDPSHLLGVDLLIFDEFLLGNDSVDAFSYRESLFGSVGRWGIKSLQSRLVVEL